MDIKKLGLSFVKNYLRLVVGLLLRVKKPLIIAVTGTAGKTTTKETIYAVLRQRFRDKVARTHGSLSTKTGIPIGLLGFTPDWTNLGPAWWQWPFWLIKATVKTCYLLLATNYPKIWIVEFAADLPGDFDFLLKYIHPRIAVVTNVGLGHTEFFGSVEGVAKEKGKLVEVLPENGFAVLNFNDELVKKMAQKTKAKTLWVRAKGLNFAPTAARIIGRLYGMSYSEIERGLKKVKLPTGRMDIFRTKNGMVVIDSSYNANPVSMLAALDVLADYPRRSIREQRKIAILGEMLELGKHVQTVHQQIYKKARLVADQVITVGEGFRNVSKNHYKDAPEAAAQVLSSLKPGDIILVKGSHGVKLNRLVKEIIK